MVVLLNPDMAQWCRQMHITAYPAYLPVNSALSFSIFVAITALAGLCVYLDAIRIQMSQSFRLIVIYLHLVGPGLGTLTSHRCRLSASVFQVLAQTMGLAD